MKKTVKLNLLFSIFLSIVVFVIGCQTKQERLIPEGEKVVIRKITDRGIETVELTEKGQAWPILSQGAVEEFKPDVSHLKIAIIGDTGCRLKEFKDQAEYQNCNDPDLWPLAKISNVIAKEDYSFLLHAGDYYYREKCTNKLFCDKYTDTYGPTWKTWWEDFYKPVASLLKKSPILFMRGNHEDCERGFRGWAPLSFKEKDFANACEAYEGFQIIQLSDLVLVNFDNSDFSDKRALKPNEEKIWKERLLSLKERLDKLSGSKEIWLLVHKPLYAYLPPKQGGGEISPIPSQFRDLVKSVGLEPLIDIAISGHIHSQEITYFAEGKIQFVIGHTATSLDPMEKIVKRKDFMTTTASHKDFGYVMASRLGFRKWSWLFKNVDGNTILSCKTENKKFDCK